MFCPNCGTKLDDNAQFCSSCGTRLSRENAPEQSAQPEQPAQPYQSEQPYPPEPPVSGPQNSWQQVVSSEPAPKDYLVPNIILTVCSALCCTCITFFGLITGIIGIVFSCMTRNAVSAGDLASASQKSRTARALLIATAVLLGIGILLSILLVATGALQSSLEDLTRALS